jgi:hypothetical protein
MVEEGLNSCKKQLKHNKKNFSSKDHPGHVHALPKDISNLPLNKANF